MYRDPGAQMVHPLDRGPGTGGGPRPDRPLCSRLPGGGRRGPDCCPHLDLSLCRCGAGPIQAHRHPAQGPGAGPGGRPGGPRSAPDRPRAHPPPRLHRTPSGPHRCPEGHRSPSGYAVPASGGGPQPGGHRRGGGRDGSGRLPHLLAGGGGKTGGAQRLLYLASWPGAGPGKGGPPGV